MFLLKNLHLFYREEQNAFASEFLNTVAAEQYITPANVADNTYSTLNPLYKTFVLQLVLLQQIQKLQCYVKQFFGNLCADVTKADLSGDSQDKEFLRYACACNMPIEQYAPEVGPDGSSIPVQQPIACDPVCTSYPSSFPALKDEGQLDTCESVTCVISDR